ncbi:dibenzothiophene desulfurziation enzyme [Rhodococcus rhodochrous]|uniref:NtaA/DmoA family FMN-dependent monooxygenase n=1 Tax=Rhodococcus rhodochrous TaxID=1829 RepID=UPI00075125EA|nr:NtaA/DmoA family FMN-dependent monooxygenase [Rhodococcus rhodochrous]MDO1485111.1 NtaA/DmoA family FMN-dependent monooxygenase [Rhodococcus rhodochrous]SNV10067.1 dibenzothiophene desulfurziation enzyme [Rhodococcus rhodochrous]
MMKLAFDLSFTHTEGRWQAPGSWVGTSYPDHRMFTEIAVTAERAGIDMLFFGDGVGVPDTWKGSMDAAVRWGIQWPRQDMSPVVAAAAQATTRIGFGLTYSSTYLHPFYLARLMNSLDHVTGGRIALNVVASGRVSDAANYGFDTLMPHDRRYERMEEFVEVCRRLWASAEPGVVVEDRTTGQYGDPTKLHRIDHRGEHFAVRGPLPTVPSPQGRPVLVQAGASPRGIAASASFADIVFGVGGDRDRQVRHRADLDAALERAGRDPATVGILWAVQVIVGVTAAEAQQRRAELLGGLSLEGIGTYLSYNSGFDFSGLPSSFVLGEIAAEIEAAQSTQAGFVAELVERLGADTRISRAEFFDAGWRHSTGYDQTIAGTVEDVADQLEDQFEATGRRGGFMITNPVCMPGSLYDVAHLLVPELRRRGLRPDSYPGSTLAENLLGRPLSCRLS